MSDPAPSEGRPVKNTLHFLVRGADGSYKAILPEEDQARRAHLREVAARPPVEIKGAPASDAGVEPTKKKRTPPADSWSEIRKKLRTWDQPRLLGLIQDLCGAMPEVRTALAGRLSQGVGEGSKTEGLKKLRAQIRVALRGKGRIPKGLPRIGEARKIVDRYYAVSADADGAIQLHGEMACVLLELECEFPGSDVPEYEAVFRAVERIGKLLPEATDLAALRELAETTKGLMGHTNLEWSDLSELALDLVEGLEARVAAG